MSKNVIVISVDIRETRVALIEDGIIAELHIERRGHTTGGSSVGSVYLGKVTRVLPGLQAAFIDIGQERAAFLHVEDLIRPDDFENYLAGGRKHAKGEDETPTEVDATEADANPPPATEAPALEAASNDASAGEEEQGESEGEGEGEGGDGDDESVDREESDEDRKVPSDAPTRGSLPELDDEESWSTPDAVAGTSQEDVSAAIATAAAAASSAEMPPEGEEDEGEDEEGGDDLDLDGLPGFTISEPGEPVPRAPAARQVDAREGGGRGGRRRRGRRGRDRGGERGGGGGGERGGGGDRGRGRSDRGDRGDRGRGDRRGAMVPARISKSTPIREVVKEGQDIVVQVTKDPISTKGARCTSHISLPGRYVVYLPTVEHVGISKRIGSDRERSRLREAIDSVKPPTGGLIVRTLAEGLTKKQLKNDVGYLVRLWGEIAKKREGARAPEELYGELDIVLKTARDMFTDEVNKIVIDDKTQYDRLCRFVEMFAPERVKDIELYGEDEPIFDAYGIEDEIGRALARKVPLPSGGYLIIDQAEALTAIDVNTGRFVGKGSKDMEETILKTNLEAVNEIAYQLRFRNIGGLIILDLIDMEKAQNREKVRRTLDELLQKDKAKTTVNRISELGLIEMTRKRTRESLGRILHEPCFYCDGTGQLQSKETIAYEILREIRRRRADLPGYTIIVNAHPAVADLLTGSEKESLASVESKVMRRIMVNARQEYHLEQFDLQGK